MSQHNLHHHVMHKCMSGLTQLHKSRTITGKQGKHKCVRVCVCMNLWPCSPIFYLAGVEALLIRVFHAGKDSCTAEACWVDGTFIMERHPVCDDLKTTHKFSSGKTL